MKIVFATWGVWLLMDRWVIVEFGESKQEQQRKMWHAKINIKNAIYSSCWRGSLLGIDVAILFKVRLKEGHFSQQRRRNLACFDLSDQIPKR